MLRRRPHLADPLLALARSWVRRRVPAFDRPAAVVQGDCGPDQFLFAGDRVTAIIDWELGHIGDPMVDLGAMRLRECLYPAGMFPFVLERYRELGMPVDDQAIRYYTVVTILFTLFGTVGGTVRLDPRNEEVILQLWWQVALRRVLCEAIAEFEGILLTPPEPLDGQDGTDVRLHELLADRIHQLARRNEEWAGELRATLALADGIVNEQRGRAARAAVNLEDLEACLESSPRDVDDGLRSLGHAIEAGPDADFERRLQTLFRLAVREQEAWLPLMRADRWTEDDGRRRAKTSAPTTRPSVSRPAEPRYQVSGSSAALRRKEVSDHLTSSGAIVSSRFGKRVEQPLHHDLDLHVREVRAEATVHAPREREVGFRVLAVEVEVPAVREHRLVAVGDVVLGDDRATRGDHDAVAQLDVFVRPADHRGAEPEAGNPPPQLLQGRRQQRADRRGAPATGAGAPSASTPST